MLLLDTCSFLWLVTDQARLSKPARSAITANAGNIYVSSISAFEIGLKYQRGLIKLPLAPQVWFKKALELHGLEELAITAVIASEAAALPPHHRDPADRLLIATAATHKLKILTPYQHIPKYEQAQVVW